MPIGAGGTVLVSRVLCAIRQCQRIKHRPWGLHVVLLGLEAARL